LSESSPASGSCCLPPFPVARVRPFLNVLFLGSSLNNQPPFLPLTAGAVRRDGPVARGVACDATDAPLVRDLARLVEAVDGWPDVVPAAVFDSLPHAHGGVNWVYLVMCMCVEGVLGSVEWS